MTHRQPGSKNSAPSAQNENKAPISRSSAPSSKPPGRRNMPVAGSKKTETPSKPTPDTMSAASRPRRGKQLQETTGALDRLDPIKRKPVPIARDVPEIEGLQPPAPPHSNGHNGGLVYRSHRPAHAALPFGFDPEPLPVSHTRFEADNTPPQLVNSAPHRPAHAAVAFGFDSEPLPASDARVMTNDTPEPVALPLEVIQARRTLHELAFAKGPWAASAKLPLPLDEVKRAQKALYDDAFPEGWPKHPEELKEPGRVSGNKLKETRQAAAGGNTAKAPKGKAAAATKPLVQRKPVPPAKTAHQPGGRMTATLRTVTPTPAAARREADKPGPSDSVARKPIAKRTVVDKPGPGHTTVMTNRAQPSQMPRSGGAAPARQMPSSAKVGAQTGASPRRTPARGGLPTRPAATTDTTTTTARRAAARSTPPSRPAARSIRTTVRTPATSSKARTAATGSAPKPSASAVAAAKVATKTDTAQLSASRTTVSKGGKKALAGNGADNKG